MTKQPVKSQTGWYARPVLFARREPRDSLLRGQARLLEEVA